jgi:hypothetical protein
MRCSQRLAAVLACSVLSLLAPNVASADGGGIGVRPAAPDGVNPVTNGFLIETVAPGTTAAGAVVVSNGTSGAVPLRVYPTDGETAVTSGAVYPTASTPPTEAGRWLNPDATNVQLAPGTEQTVGFSVRVPADASAGDHVAAIAVEQPASASGPGQVSIGEVVRDVVPIDVRVSGPASAQARLSSLAASTIPGTQLPAVMVGIGDGGTLMCRPSLSVSLTSDSGHVTVLTRQLDLLLPGDTISYPFPLPAALRSGTSHLSATASGCGGAVTLNQPAPAGPRGAQPGANPIGARSTSPEAPRRVPHGRSPRRSLPRLAVRRRQRTRPHGSIWTPRPGRRLADHLAPARRVPHDGHLAGLAWPASRPGLRANHHGSTEVGRIAAAVLRAARTVAHKAAFPLSLLVIVVVYLLIQDAIDRRDPKLALAPTHRDPMLSFIDPPNDDHTLKEGRRESNTQGKARL